VEKIINNFMEKNQAKQPLEVGSLSVHIDIVKESLYDNKGKVIKDPQGNVSYKREDYNGLMSLLNKFDSRLHDFKDMKIFLRLKDKIYQGWMKDKKQLDLSIDEAGFLQRFLSGIREKDGRDSSLREFEMRTLVGLLEELG